MIKSNWINWCNENYCPLCKREGDDIATVYKKGHYRNNGIILEWGLSYCKDCYNTKACEEHWQQAWKDMWREQEELCEENWKKYGVYTNVAGIASPVSFHFGYAKTPNGLRPYLEVHPDCPKHSLENEVIKLRRQFGKQLLSLMKESKADEEFKKELLDDTIDFLKVLCQ